MELPPPRVEPTPRWVRVRGGDVWVADSRRARVLAWYGPRMLPTYCFPAADVRTGLVRPSTPVRPDDRRRRPAPSGHALVMTTGHMNNMDRLEAIVAALPEAERVDIAEWGDHPTFRVRGKNFVFSDQAATELSLKLPKDEAAAVVATDPAVSPTGYGLGRHGWIAFTVDEGAGDDRWVQIEEWVRTSYTLVAPKSLARLVTP